MVSRGLLGLLGLVLPVGAIRAVAEWRYVVPAADAPFAHPPLRAVSLSNKKPPDLKENVHYRGTRQRYAQLNYGSGRTGAVAIVVDEIGPMQFDLYVDAGRDRDITLADRVPGENLTWRILLKAVVPDGNAIKETPARTVLFRYGPVSRTLSVATCGYIE